MHPRPRVPCLPPPQWPSPERSEDFRISPCSRSSPGTHLGAGPPSAPAAPAAGRRPPTRGLGPAPRAPPWVPSPGAAALRPRTLPGPEEATASGAPGRCLSYSPRCWALRPRAALGPGASGRTKAERPGGGAVARGGARGSLRRAAGVRRLCAPLRGDSGCPDATRVPGPGRAGTVRGGARPGLSAGAYPGPAPSRPAPRAAG